MSTAQLSEPRELSLHGSLSFLGYSADAQLGIHEWIEDGAALATMEKGIRFAIGDWIVFGESRYGEAHAQAIDATALSYSSINSARWVASRIPETRRRSELSWSHHEAVASLVPAEQDALLAQAITQKLDREQTRESVRARKGLPPPQETVTLPKKQFNDLKELARHADLDAQKRYGDEWNDPL